MQAELHRRHVHSYSRIRLTRLHEEAQGRPPFTDQGGRRGLALRSVGGCPENSLKGPLCTSHGRRLPDSPRVSAGLLRFLRRRHRNKSTERVFPTPAHRTPQTNVDGRPGCLLAIDTQVPSFLHVPAFPQNRSDGALHVEGLPEKIASFFPRRTLSRYLSLSPHA